MRKAVTFLQSVARFRNNTSIKAADVQEITGVCKSKLKQNCFLACLDRVHQVTYVGLFLTFSD